EASDCATDVGAAAQPPLPRVRILLQALSECAGCEEDQRLDRCLVESQLGRDFPIGEALPFPQQDGAALVLRHLLEHVLQTDELVAHRLVATRDDFLENLEVVRRLDPAAPPRRAAAREAHVVGDLEEPGGLELGDDAPRQAAECVHERRLDGVLRLLARAELVQAVAEDLDGVPLVELARRVRARSGFSLDARCSTYGRDCGHPVLLLLRIRTLRPGASVERVSAGDGRATTLHRGSLRPERAWRRAPGAAARTGPRARAAGSG